jgi:hypothetical protein
MVHFVDPSGSAQSFSTCFSVLAAIESDFAICDFYLFRHLRTQLAGISNSISGQDIQPKPIRKLPLLAFLTQTRA